MSPAPIEKGQYFSSLQDFKDTVEKIADIESWNEMRTTSSDNTRVILVCKEGYQKKRQEKRQQQKRRHRTGDSAVRERRLKDCNFIIVARSSRDVVRVTQCELRHTCGNNFPGVSRRGYMENDIASLFPNLKGVTAPDVIERLAEKHELSPSFFSLRTVQRILADLRRKLKDDVSLSWPCPSCGAPIQGPPPKYPPLYRESIKICRKHKRSDAEAEWANKSYPSIEWDALPERLRGLSPKLKQLLLGLEESFQYKQWVSRLIEAGRPVGQPLRSGRCDTGYYGGRVQNIM
jgi:hypothetical protein